MADVAEVRPVVLRNRYCFLLYSSHVRNFSCSAWNSRTTSPPFNMSSWFSYKINNSKKYSRNQICSLLCRAYRFCYFLIAIIQKKCYYSLGIWRLYPILIVPCKHFVHSCEVGREACTYIDIVEFLFNYKKLLFYQDRDMLD